MTSIPKQPVAEAPVSLHQMHSRGNFPKAGHPLAIAPGNRSCSLTTLFTFPTHCMSPGRYASPTRPLRVFVPSRRVPVSCMLVGNKSNFLLQHPIIESLFLETEQTFQIAMTDMGLKGKFDNTYPALCALSVDKATLVFCPNILSPHITHFHLYKLDIDMDADVTDTMHTLGIFRPVPPDVLLRWAGVLLTTILTIASPNTPLCTLCVHCEVALLSVWLSNLKPLPPRLKYIRWDEVVYLLKDRVVAETLMYLCTEDDWTRQGVLSFMGEE
ncbi:hypothetical protein DFH08DRAFT_799168 [Mycena albidolilacea]|uniref:Uncharacterized protein n=1 Tax=Mycena albidolilacea TaxID=1033008 RepID=A0AAD7F4G6_9AGAR|nr:hypothetical protein DFH08DRAFT_799168 [Mycena albidolilacea]